MNTRRKAVSLGAAGLALCMCVTLGACEGQLPEPVQATASASASPNLTTEQEKAIRKQLLEAIEQCNNAKSADGLDRAMSGPELEIRRSELAVAQKTGNLDPKTDIPDAITQTIIPTDSGWPRSVFTITTTTQDQQSKRLLVFDQESARQNYKLWGVARLFQGVQMPKFTVPQIGAQMGTDNDEALRGRAAERRQEPVCRRFRQRLPAAGARHALADRATGHGAQQGHANADLRAGGRPDAHYACG